MINNRKELTPLWQKALDKRLVEGTNKARNVADAIKDIMSSGSLPDDEKIPTQAQLIDWLKTSKSTAQLTFNYLKAEGLIHTDGSRGAMFRGNMLSKEDKNITSHGREIFFNSLTLPSSKAFYKKINALKNASDIDFENLNPEEKEAIVNPRLKIKLRTFLNNELPGKFQENEVYYNVTRRNTIFNIFNSFLKAEQIFVVANPAELWFKNIHNSGGGRCVLIGSDEFGPSVIDLIRICLTGKLGILYLNTRYSFSNNRLISRRRIKEILDLQREYGFLIIEDDLFPGMYRDMKNIFMELAIKEKSNIIYLRSLTMGYYISNKVIAIASSAGNISILKASIFGMGKIMDAALCATTLELLENGDVMRNEKGNYLKILKINELARHVLGLSKLWKVDGFINREGMFFHLVLIKGKLPDNIYEILAKKGIYIFNQNNYHWIPGSIKGITISIGNYIDDSRLKQDLEYLLDAIKDIIQP